jgi:hypothetical protein
MTMTKRILSLRVETEAGDLICYFGEGSVNSYETRVPMDGILPAKWLSIEVATAHMRVTDVSVIHAADRVSMNWVELPTISDVTPEDL